MTLKTIMEARLVYHQKFVYSDGAVREMILWRMPEKSADRPPAVKYRLYFGRADGTGIVRYGNEPGEDDHRHFSGDERPYKFIDVDTLVTDFLADIEKARKGC